MRANIALIFYFSLVATLCDRTWVALGVTAYPRYPGQQAWWAPLMFAAVGFIAVHFADWISHMWVPTSARQPDDVCGSFAIGASWFVAAYIAVGLFDATRARRVAAILVVIWLIRVLLQWPRGCELCAVLVISIGTAAAGTIVEIVLGRCNIMLYARPAFCGVPFWLPGLYLQGGLLARDIGRKWFGGR